MAIWTTSTKAARSWSVTLSRSWTAATNSAVTAGARSRISLASSLATTPSGAHASAASTSTSSHRARRAWSVNNPDIGDRAYRPIKAGSAGADALRRGGPQHCPPRRSPPYGDVETVRQAPVRRGKRHVPLLSPALLYRLPGVRPRPEQGPLLHPLRPDCGGRAVHGRRPGPARPGHDGPSAGQLRRHGRSRGRRHPGAVGSSLIRSPLGSEVVEALGQPLV